MKKMIFLLFTALMFVSCSSFMNVLDYLQYTSQDVPESEKKNIPYKF